MGGPVDTRPTSRSSSGSRSWLVLAALAVLAACVIAFVSSSSDDVDGDNATTRAETVDGGNEVESGNGVVEGPIPGSINSADLGLGTADTPIGEVAYIPYPGEDSCADLEAFPFEEIEGLEAAGWSGALDMEVDTIDLASRSIDMSTDLEHGYFVIRDGRLVANMREGDHLDSTASREYWDTWVILVLDHPDHRTQWSSPSLQTSDGAADCTYLPGYKMEEGE